MLPLLTSIHLRTKLWVGLGGLFLILLACCAISAVVLSHFGNELQKLLRENYDSEVYCKEMIDALDLLDASARQLAWDEAGTHENPAAQEARFDRNLLKQLKNVTLPGESEETRTLQSQWSAYRAAMDALQSAQPAQRQMLYRQTLGPTYQQARATARRIAVANMNNLVSADGRVRANIREVRKILLILLGAGAVLAVVVFLLVGVTVLNPIRDLTRSVGRVAAGELDLAVPVRTQDEVGQLAAEFNAMAQRLAEYRKRDRELLVRAQSTTQLAIDSLHDAVLVTNPQGIIEIANQTAITHFAADPGRPIADLGLPWLEALHRDALAGREIEPVGYSSAVQLFQNGEEKFLLPRGVPMLHDGRVVGVAITLVDVTRLRQADEFKSGLVSTVSHELRTPLTSMRMSTNMLADQTLGPLNAAQTKLVTAARDESERLYRIIENLLNFSRAQAGAARVKPRAVSVQDLINEALTPMAGAFGEKKIAVRVSADGAPDAWADPPLAASVLTNLLSNALKFTPPLGQVQITAAAKDDLVEISIFDTGPGVAPEHVAKLFHRFFRVAGPSAPPGTGLGLAISREIAIAHDGTLTYSARSGGGSVFHFALPMASGKSE